VIAAVWVFGVVLCVHTLSAAAGATGTFFELPQFEPGRVFESLMITLVLAFGLMLLLAQFRSVFRNNDPYGLAIRPLVVGIAGDSGSGKDTLSTALARVFGENEVVAVSGDDYHTWERGSPLWKIWTHLNPSANQLSRLAEDLRTLVHGGAIQCRSYDHATGRFDPRRKKRHNDVVLVSGLHTLYSPQLREVLDVKIYLDMAEDLRRHLKIQRDTIERNHPLEAVLASIDRRLPDYLKFIAPQQEQADLVFRLAQADSLDLSTLPPAQPVPLRLEARTRRGLKFDELSRLLTAFCWCETSLTQGNAGEMVFAFEGGDLQPEDVEQIVALLIPDCEELIALHPSFQGGVTGMMQVLVLMQVETNRRNAPFAVSRRSAELG
jgi:uridine kinase